VHRRRTTVAQVHWERLAHVGDESRARPQVPTLCERVRTVPGNQRLAKPRMGLDCHVIAVLGIASGA
jgi:hypothetical protein